MATPGKLIHRYAKAVFNAAGKGEQGGRVLAEVRQFSQVLGGHSELRTVVDSPGFSLSDKLHVVEQVVKKLGLCSASSRILLGLAEMRRLGLLATILNRVDQLVLQSQGVTPVEVHSAGPLADAEKQEVEERFRRILGSKVQAAYQINPSLVGGVRVVASGRTYDGTLAGWLGLMKERLVEGEA